MEKATAAKCALEQKQREEARIRKETNINWQTKVCSHFNILYFHIFLLQSTIHIVLSFNSCSRIRKTVVGCI